MNDEKFWELVESSKGTGGDIEHSRRLLEQLQNLTPLGILDFYKTYQSKIKEAENTNVWAAGMLINKGHGSDDAFLYFRNWLIGQGSEIYTKTISNPDSLASLPFQDNAEWESYGFSITTAYKNKTGNSIPTTKEATSSEIIEFISDTKTLKKILPNLFKKYEKNLENPSTKIQSNYVDIVEIDGIGIIKVGANLTHKKYGVGKVIYLEKDKFGATAIIEFSDGKKPMNLSAHYASLWSLN